MAAGLLFLGFFVEAGAQVDPRLLAARARHYEGNWEEALPLYVQVASKQQGRSEALLAVASILEERRGDFARAAKLYLKVSKDGSYAKEAVFWLALLKGELLQVTTRDGASLKGFRLDQDAVSCFAGRTADAGTVYLLLEGGTVEAFPVDSLRSWTQVPIDPPASDLWLEDAGAYRKRKYEQILRYLPRSALSHVWYAALLREEGRLLGALLHLERAAALDFDHPPCQAKRGFLLLSLGESQEGTEEISSFLERNRDLSCLSEEDRRVCQSISNYLSGERHRDAGDPRKAREAYVASIKLSDEFSPAYFSLAECLVALRKDELAVEAFKEGLALTPFSAAGHMGLCFALDRLGDRMGAAKAYVSSQEILGTPRQDEAFQAWGQQAVQEARELLSQRRRRAARSAELHNIGVHYLELGLLDEAEDAFRQAMVSGGGSPATWASLGNCLMALERFEEAIQTYEAALKLEDDRETTRANLAHLLYVKEDYKASRSQYERLADSKNEQMRADAHYNLGIIHLRLKEHQPALKEFALALAADPRHVRAHNNLGIAQEELGLLDQAERSYLKAIGLSPWHRSARLNLAALLCGQGRDGEAILCLRSLRETPLWDEDADLLWKRAQAKREESHHD